MRSKPLIGLNADYRAAKKDAPAFSYVCSGYYDSVKEAGGVPVILPPVDNDVDLNRLLDLLDVLYALFPSAPPTEIALPRAGDIYRSVGSPQKAKDIIDFKATTSLSEGLKETVESMRQQSPISNLQSPISIL